MNDPPLLIRFVENTRLRREAAFSSGLPIIGNGPPGTFVVFPNGREVPLPTDQIVASHDDSGAALVSFGDFALMAWKVVSSYSVVSKSCGPTSSFPPNGVAR